MLPTSYYGVKVHDNLPVNKASKTPVPLRNLLLLGDTSGRDTRRILLTCHGHQMCRGSLKDLPNYCITKLLRYTQTSRPSWMTRKVLPERGVMMRVSPYVRIKPAGYCFRRQRSLCHLKTKGDHHALETGSYALHSPKSINPLPLGYTPAGVRVELGFGVASHYQVRLLSVQQPVGPIFQYIYPSASSNPVP